MVRHGAGSKIRMTYAEALFDAKGEKGNRNEIEGKHILGITDEFTVAGVVPGEDNPRSDRLRDWYKPEWLPHEPTSCRWGGGHGDIWRLTSRRAKSLWRMRVANVVQRVSV